MGLLVLLAGMLLPVWGLDAQRYESNVTGEMVSAYLPVALAMMLALRCGALDLSAWSVMGLGGLVAAGLINAGVPVWLAFVAAGAAGLGVGLVNGLLVSAARLPSIVVTLLVALAIVYAADHVIPGRSVAIPDGTFDDWHLTRAVAAGEDGQAHIVAFPLLVTRMLLSAGAYAATMLLLVGGDLLRMARRAVPGERRLLDSRRWQLFAALCASGLLAGLGGAIWLLDAGKAPLPTRCVDDLRPLAAAILAGGLLLGGRSRTLLAGICLPPALLVATIWRQEVWPLQINGYDLNLVLLMAMTLAAHASLSAAVGLGRRRWTLAAVMTVMGVLLAAGAPATGSYAAGRAFTAAGIILSLGGLIVLLVGRRKNKPPHAVH